MSFKKEFGKLFNSALGLSILIISAVISKLFYDLVSPDKGSAGGFILLLLSFVFFFISVILIHFLINYLLKLSLKLSKILAEYKRKKQKNNSPSENPNKMLVGKSDKKTQESIIYCEQCGVEISDDAKFCFKCGSEVIFLQK